MARPRKDIDARLVREAAKLGCSTPEIAVLAGCSVDTLDRRFADVLAKGREDGKRKLRRIQWKLAERGNATMCIWLGKQLLGQKDRQEHEHTGKDGGPITVRWGTVAGVLPE